MRKLPLSRAGRHRPELGAHRRDFPAAQNELEHQAVGLYLESQRAYSVLCSTARTLTIHCTSDIVEVPPEERELLRAKFEAALTAGSPGYVTKALARAEPAA